MSNDPFRIVGPAVISFSGGRTSAYLLWRILQAHGGTLPDDVVVCFANTGREMPATLDFVRDCGAAWGVPVVWLEYRWEPGRQFYKRVNHSSASRAGEPFEAMVQGKSMLPNSVMRFCTTEMKVRTIKRFVQAELGWARWRNVIGLRADEARRVLRARMNGRERWTVECPLYDAGVSKQDVLEFWSEQDFDLMLAGPWEGNCDGCFLKSSAAIQRMFQDHPEVMAWWSALEAAPVCGGTAAKFRNDRTYAELERQVAQQPRLAIGGTDGLDGCMFGCAP